MYGRNQELKQLISAWDQIKENKLELFLVSGYSGIGKTRLINEIRKPVLESNGYFISGKFDQFNRETPYSAFGMAFNGFIQQLLSEQDEQIALWRNAIKESLGDHVGLLLGVIPELGILVENQEAIYEISHAEGKSVFTMPSFNFKYT